MSVYLHDIPLVEAFARLDLALEQAGRGGLLGSEDILLDEQCIGRVLVEPVWAKISSPHYHASAMDGFALCAADTADADLNKPVTLLCNPIPGLSPAAYLDTGDPLPEWADAVIPIENVEPIDEQDLPAKNPRRPYAIRIRSSVVPWSHIRPLGEDIVASQLVLPAGHTLRPVDLGAIAACGHIQVCVARRPRVAVLPTGTELVEIGQPIRPGDIIEFNSLVLAAQVKQWGGEPTRYAITPDNLDAIQERVRQAASENDLVLLNAGSSAGSEDFSARVVEGLGELLVHGVAVRPGHPVILGMIRSGDSKIPIIGVPGYPVSAALTGEIFVQPLLARWLGRQPEQPVTVNAVLTRKVTSPPGDDDYLRVAVGRVGQKLLAAPLARGSGVITSLVRADGIAILPRGSQGLPAGASVSVRLYRNPADLENTIFAIGSHDMTLDLLAQYLAKRDRRLASANVGSQGGLVALRRGEAHLAGSHLLDPETGEYNLKYIREYLPGIPVKVVALVDREQGLMVLRGNPKNLRTLGELAKPGVSFVNRQRGAGTRVLLDYQLRLLGISTETIQGYSQEEYTHLAVAAAVASRRADCGLGIAAAAQALDLDFVPLFNERYELVIPDEYYHSELLSPLFEVLADPAFRQAVAALPGYGVTRMGNLVAEL
jgi:molybdopterin molybdotransferase/putative molybdopterin biosynthesis protein